MLKPFKALMASKIQFSALAASAYSIVVFCVSGTELPPIASPIRAHVPVGPNNKPLNLAALAVQ